MKNTSVTLFDHTSVVVARTRALKKHFALISLLSLSSVSAVAKEQTVTLDVPTMNCVTCPFTVKKALQKVEGVKSADVSYDTKLAVVIFDDEKTTLKALTGATTNAGYPSTVKQK
ncbi:mercury resistance system periplasmic binding protein MerP [Rheinheimera sp.]|uniref:mercury resistance system periplasmic binding protein MerP n=1 Tax=Rheinheimera sp. TaxID=1869214 RepID=UPI004047833A